MPRTADPKIRRAEVVSAAAELIANEGPEAISMRKIAERAGCTIGLLNHWFSSKNDLIEAVLDDAATAAGERCTLALQRTDVTLEDVVSEFLPLDEARASELKVWLVFWGLSIGRPELRKGYGRRVATMREQLTQEIERQELITEGITEFVDALMSALDGIAVNALADPDYWTPARQKQTLQWLLKRSVDEA